MMVLNYFQSIPSLFFYFSSIMNNSTAIVSFRTVINDDVKVHIYSVNKVSLI